MVLASSMKRARGGTKVVRCPVRHATISGYGRATQSVSAPAAVLKCFDPGPTSHCIPIKQHSTRFPPTPLRQPVESWAIETRKLARRDLAERDFIGREVSGSATRDGWTFFLPSMANGDAEWGLPVFPKPHGVAPG